MLSPQRRTILVDTSNVASIGDSQTTERATNSYPITPKNSTNSQMANEKEDISTGTTDIKKPSKKISPSKSELSTSPSPNVSEFLDDLRRSGTPTLTGPSSSDNDLLNNAEDDCCIYVKKTGHFFNDMFNLPESHLIASMQASISAFSKLIFLGFLSLYLFLLAKCLPKRDAFCQPKSHFVSRAWIEERSDPLITSICW